MCLKDTSLNIAGNTIIYSITDNAYQVHYIGQQSDIFRTNILNQPRFRKRIMLILSIAEEKKCCNKVLPPQLFKG